MQDALVAERTKSKAVMSTTVRTYAMRCVALLTSWVLVGADMPSTL